MHKLFFRRLIAAMGFSLFFYMLLRCEEFSSNSPPTLLLLYKRWILINPISILQSSCKKIQGFGALLSRLLPILSKQVP